MAKIHITLQGKGGVGKSFIAATVAQRIAAKVEKPMCIDIDPVNATFHGYTSLDVRRLQVMEDDEINSRKFDDLIELLAPQSETYGRDLSDMLQARLTFDEAIALSSLTIMTRQRLKIIKGQLFDQLDNSTVI